MTSNSWSSPKRGGSAAGAAKKPRKATNAQMAAAVQKCAVRATTISTDHGHHDHTNCRSRAIRVSQPFAVDGQLEEAARNLGASPLRCFASVTLPLAAPGLMASAIFVFLESLDEFTGTYFVGVPDVTTLPLLMFNASMGGNYQIASITALLLLVPSIAFMLLVERFLKADVLAMIGR